MASPSLPPAAGFQPWSETDTRVGIEAFDAEHLALARLIEHLHTAALVKRDRAQAGQIFTLIVQKARAHFVHEEDLLYQHGYRELEQHTEQHSLLLKEVQEVQRAYAAGNLSALLLLRFLQNWLVQHIKTSDQQYRHFLRDKGII